MKLLNLLAILFCMSCSQLARSPAGGDVVDVVFDIDWTIVYELGKYPESKVNEAHVYKVEGKSYYLASGFLDFIEDLVKRPDVRISFFSGGEESRNEKLLNAIRLSNGKSLREESYKILSYHDLTKVEGVSKEESFAKRFKKDLRKINPDLRHVFLFDDIDEFLFDWKIQESNSFFHGTTSEYFSSFKEAQRYSGKYVPKTYDEWFLSTQKMHILHEAFLGAYQKFHQNKQPFSLLMKKEEALLDLGSLRVNTYSRSYYERSLQRQKTKPSKAECFALMTYFL